jgi:hypothetical protein
MIERVYRSCGWLLLLVGFAGCGKASDSAQVSGTVTVSGQPLPGGVVSFFPATGERAINATVDTGGHYHVALPPGDYTVTAQVSRPMPEGWQEGDPLPPPPVLQVPAKFRQPKSSPLTFTVEAAGPMEKDFELE